MNYFAARQRESGKRWDYTCKNDSRIWPVGYCAGWREPKPEHWGSQAEIDRWLERTAPHRHKFHEDGHETDEQACECYKQYLLDFELHLDEENLNMQRKCAVCGAWTSKFARVSMRIWDLCDEHRTREHVEVLHGPVGMSWEG